MSAVMLSVLLALVPAHYVVRADPPDAPVVEAPAGAGPAEEGDVRQVAVRALVRGGDDARGREALVLAVAGADEEGKDAELPKVWIGVRVTPVPAPLAAHIGEQGVMISNVVVDGPADRAGVKQYDVVVRFNGRPVSSPRALTDAIGAATAGEPARLTIVRGGREQELEITPAARPESPDYALKYPEPEDDFIDSAFKMRGLKLHRGPGGLWGIEELGPLKGPPEVLKKLEELDLDIRLDDLPTVEFFGPGGGGVRILRRPGAGLRWLVPGDEADVKAEVELKLKVKEDGKTTAIHATPDGKISVTRVDAEGKESSATYDSPEALEAADPEAYELYERHSGAAGPPVFRFRPFGKEAAKARQEYQIEVEKKLREVLDRARDAGAAAEDRAAEARREVEKTLVRRYSAGAADTTNTLLVQIDESGAVSVVDIRDGVKRKYEFPSKAAFEAAEPELYERVKGLIE